MESADVMSLGVIRLSLSISSCMASLASAYIFTVIFFPSRSENNSCRLISACSIAVSIRPASLASLIRLSRQLVFRSWIIFTASSSSAFLSRVLPTYKYSKPFIFRSGINHGLIVALIICGLWLVSLTRFRSGI